MSDFSFKLCDSDTIFEQEMLVGKLEGGISILGIDFLMKYAGIVNLRKRHLHLGKQIFPLSENPTHVHKTQ
jgi:hypothetical protein